MSGEAEEIGDVKRVCREYVDGYVKGWNIRNSAMESLNYTINGNGVCYRENWKRVGGVSLISR